MIATRIRHTSPAPPSAKLLGWHLLDARPQDGWIRIGFDGKRRLLQPGRLRPGRHPLAMLDDTMGPAVFAMTEGKTLHRDHHHDGELSGTPPKTGSDHRRSDRDPARQDGLRSSRAG